MGKLIFTDRAWNEYRYWQQQDKKTLNVSLVSGLDTVRVMYLLSPPNMEVA